jgi:hypothetical protein
MGEERAVSSCKRRTKTTSRQQNSIEGTRRFLAIEFYDIAESVMAINYPKPLHPGQKQSMPD